ncbi:hypothetical protein [Bacillus sp. B15-48]|uniref:hypothetical protein n=1 Tax=Bacillus sp. B15-48 TaxID=1548601 RepID=UPI001940030A|nr:hypothetical protein [Bacillus sp. B15-48]MBM4763735.1 hypothetical protein [Bacillus sp. B15-48]
MIWMYIGVTIIFIIGAIFIIWGIKLTKEKHKKAEYIDGIATYDAGLVASIVIFLLSFILKIFPYWLMKAILILFGSLLIGFGVFLLIGKEL